MKKLLIALLTLSTITTQASVLEQKDETNYFEMLGDLYVNGTEPDLEKISNILWAGRCFYDDKPNEPKAAALIIRQKKNYLGPIASDEKSYEVFDYTLILVLKTISPINGWSK